MKKVTFALLLVLGLYFLLSFTPAFAGVLNSEVAGTIKSNTDNAGTAAGFTAAVGTMGLATLISTAIKAFLGILGIVFLIITIHAGYMWMMAGGESAKVDKAKDSIFRAVIGLIIVVSAYALTAFVFRAVGSAAGGGDGVGTVTTSGE